MQSKVLIQHFETILAPLKLALIDVGARNFFLPKLAVLSKRSRLIAIEPEASEYERLKRDETLNQQWQNLTVVPDALGSIVGPAKLFVTTQPGLTSLYEPNNTVVDKFYQTDEWKIKKELTVNMITLDIAAAKYSFLDAAFIKVDTQGSELDILKSGEGLIKKSIVGIYLETEFQEFYKKQPLFSDIDQYLRKANFELYELDRVMIRRAGQGDTSRFYSRRQMAWAHCLYLRDYTTIDTISIDNILLLTRLFMICLAFEHHDTALEIANLPQVRRYWFEQCGIALDTHTLSYVEMITRMKLQKQFRRKIKKVAANLLQIAKNTNNELLSFSYHDRKKPLA